MNQATTIYGWWTPRRVSFLFIAVVILMIPLLHLATPLLAILFSTFVLRKLDFGRGRWISIILFSCVVGLIFYAFAEFVRHAALTLPGVADESVPKFIAFAEQHGMELPFDNVSDLKSLIGREMADRFADLTNIAKLATKEVVLVLLGMVVACSIFMSPTLDVAPSMHKVRNNLYSAYCEEIAHRFRAFYISFNTVMGAQIIISAINATLTGIFIFSTSMKHPLVLLGVTFLCGLLPIIGNIISNCVIVAVGFTMSPMMAVAALVFLVALHKFEYFLNSKIIGDRIRNPVWLTMLGLVVGEKVLGIPGMILAPVVLYYVKIEMGAIPVGDSPDAIQAPDTLKDQVEPKAP